MEGFVPGDGLCCISKVLEADSPMTNQPVSLVWVWSVGQTGCALNPGSKVRCVKPTLLEPSGAGLESNPAPWINRGAPRDPLVTPHVCTLLPWLFSLLC